MSDAEKKQAWYIANAQGYVLEFRLSENTVNSYATYCTERDNYKTGANPGGGWVPFRNWLIDNNFTCTWCDRNVPSKNGVTTLASGLDSVLRQMIIKDGVRGTWICYVGGWMDGGNGPTHSNSKDPANGNGLWGLFYNGDDWLDYGDLADLTSGRNIILVRPL